MNAGTEMHGDGKTANFTSKQRYCVKLLRCAAGTHEISDNHYLSKLVNFSQLQKVEKSVQLHSPWAKLPTQCAFENKRLLLSVVIWRSTDLKMQLGCCCQSLSATTKDQNLTRMERMSPSIGYLFYCVCFIIFLTIVLMKKTDLLSWNK